MDKCRSEGKDNSVLEKKREEDGNEVLRRRNPEAHG